MDKLAVLNAAYGAGADRAAELPPAALAFSEEFGALCRGNACGFYGANHACPPGCGRAEELFDRVAKCGFLVLFQKDYPLDGSFDIRGMESAAKRFAELCRRVRGACRSFCPGAMVYGAGACALCEKCAYPAACRFPDEIIYPLEACGIDVYKACEAAGLPLRCASGQVTYTGIAAIPKKT